MYRKEDASLNFVKREEEIVAFWKDNNIFEQSLSKTKNAKEFSFYDGPPTANGKPHIGHVLTRVIKDILPRYKTMQGFHVTRKAGWDTHGLPVELEVEKSLGLDGKGQIESYGIEPFIKKCKESVFKYVTDWEDISNRIGYWVDMDNPYITYTDDYIESVWWSIKQIFDKDLIYKGHKIVPYCPRCGTALSSHEVAQGYKDIKETTAVVKFKVSGILPSFAKKLSWINQFLNPNTFILAWTTTPWTLPSNVALCTNPDFDYSLIECEGERFILANQLISSHFEENTYKVLVTKKGSQWEGLQYSPLFPLDYTVFKSTNNQNIYSITCDNYVTLDSGTGVVHIAPAFGEDDSRVGKKYDLPFVQVVDTAGKFRPPFDDKYSGVFVKDADKQLIKDLKQQSLIKSLPEVTHSYPFCWRCDTPLIYYARPTWFIKMTAVKDKLIKNNAKVNWIPESIGSGRMGNFLENVVDWGLSRERYWGTPLPIWVCECGHIQAIGSK
ncbi:MAG: class I tRNA ligase family protein, partial [Firmicutes bacterium]|nr:class I tRNA ligase family protein [Bacillota bacterium]